MLCHTIWHIFSHIFWPSNLICLPTFYPALYLAFHWAFYLAFKWAFYMALYHIISDILFSLWHSIGQFFTGHSDIPCWPCWPGLQARDPHLAAKKARAIDSFFSRINRFIYLYTYQIVSLYCRQIHIQYTCTIPGGYGWDCETSRLAFRSGSCAEREVITLPRWKVQDLDRNCGLSYSVIIICKYFLGNQLW